jgi:kinesin family protein 2/24
VILEEEEVLISTHRSHIDQVVEVVKQDMSLLQQVDMPNLDIEDYVLKLD